METQRQQQRGVWARDGRVYWAVFNRIPTMPIVSGSHYGTRVDCATECDGLHGHVFSSEEAARARLAILPTHYSKDGVAGAGAPIGREVGRVLYHGGYFYDVASMAAADLKAGDTVNMAGEGASAPYWQRVASVDYFARVGGREGSGHGADVYSVVWEGGDMLEAPSLLSSRQRYEVVKLRY